MCHIYILQLNCFVVVVISEVLAREEGLVLHGQTRTGKYELLLQQPIDTNCRTAFRYDSLVYTSSLGLPSFLRYSILNYKKTKTLNVHVCVHDNVCTFGR